jgi:hypothetical protein
MSNSTSCGRDSSSTMLKSLRASLLGLFATLIGACGGGETASPEVNACSDGCGTAMLTMTDAEGDFLSYVVDVTSLKLRKADGTIVETLPVTSRIDFSQLVNLSEILSTGQIPTGQYVAATLNVDFSDSDIVVEGSTGTGVTVTPVNSAGQALGQVELTVQLDRRHHLMINRSRVSHLAFDLDLAASNTVDLATSTVTVSPVVVASVLPPESRQVRARGRLASVDLAGSSYTINLRPFHEDAASSGQLVVHTTNTTRFEINGSVSSGIEGLTRLAALTDQPVTIAFGTIAGADHAFTARRVLAATSAEDAHRDYLSGNVISRTGNALVVAGLSARRSNEDSRVEISPVAVTVGPSTLVTRDGQGAGTMSIGDISVGQRVEVFGELARDQAGHATMDASNGRVRLNYTHLSGKVKATTSGMTLELLSIDGRSPARFNFAGTGGVPATDADPANYEVNTGALSTSGMLAGAYTRLFGFVTPFGAAPPDFAADTLLDFSELRAGLSINWGLGGAVAPFSTSTPTRLTLNLANDLRGAIKLGDRIINLSTLATGLALVPATEGQLTFAIAHRGSREVENFSSFADFSGELGTELNGTTAMFSLSAEGTFDAAGGTFTAKRLLVVLGN